MVLQVQDGDKDDSFAAATRECARTLPPSPTGPGPEPWPPGSSLAHHSQETHGWGFFPLSPEAPGSRA